MKGIIYKISNSINNKVYIGQTNSLERRWKQHLLSYKNPTVSDYDSKKHRAFRKYGVENFTCEVIEEVDIKDLDEREIYWIKFYDSVENGYNTAYGGSMPNLKGEDHSQATITQSDVDKIMEYLEKTDVSYDEIVLEFNISKAMISNINKGNNWISKNKSYPLRESSQARRGEQNGQARFSDKEILEIRKLYENLSITQIQEIYKDRVSGSAIRHILSGESYKHLPVYKKSKKMWIETCID